MNSDLDILIYMFADDITLIYQLKNQGQIQGQNVKGVIFWKLKIFNELGIEYI